MLNRLAQKVWHSPTFMTWGSLASRTLGLIILLPMVLTKLHVEDVVVWQLFTAVFILQNLLDFGLSPTFVRVIAYGMGGAEVSELGRIREAKEIARVSHEPDWNTVRHVMHAMKRAYLRLGLASFLIAVTLGSWGVYSSVSRAVDPGSAWAAWGFVVLSSSMRLYGNQFGAILQGVNKVALFQRVQIYTSIWSVVSAIAVLQIGGSLLALVLAYQSGFLLNVLIMYWLKGQVHAGKLKLGVDGQEYRSVFSVIWPAAWRSGVGIAASAGVVQLSGVVYANLGETEAVASYLLGLQLVRAISSFSQAPFYSRLPEFSKLYAQNKIAALLHRAKSAMRAVYSVYAFGFVAICLLGDTLLRVIGSSVEFPAMGIWATLGFGIFAERFGGMHIQLYSASGHIVWHTANGVSAGVMVLFAVAFYNVLGIVAFPMAILVGNLSFFCWYAAMYSYREYKLSFFRFERTVMLPALLLMGIAVIFVSV